ncbi:aldehyde dehydrogenase family protein [Streptomyces griseoviridis]|jgi:aldehyde dehydrogenase (NAD+)|uniref:Aldehyde dehydrogenase n=2 Tax=Streptomyces griseoviridis TaxID=45398 RepID=A0A918GUU8_STRGD|nr:MULTISPECIES: aldehyde dehydrogenase family protein [Streptomyces]MDP9680397.1 aldehyde dehydrogenase (NAD+) [Streptomyces griseoviridis]GGS67201.1 aldehyde dehydrogenase [Streptomyces niveoruber]GGT16330.1 aldehyde dehydrogenase [Streptomyces griseoviridis]
MAEHFPRYVDGGPAPAQDGATFRTFEPATRRHLADVPRCGPADVETAVAAARRAFDRGPWPRMAPDERAAVLRRIAERISAESGRLAELEVRDNGTTVRKALGADVPGARAAFAWSAWWAERLPTRLGRPGTTEGRSPHYLRWQPLGVVAAIVPWNLPLLLAAWRIAPAIAAGNTCVVKPASFTSLTALELVRLMHECGLPPGVVNVVTGPGGTTGDSLVRARGVDLVAFTGSDAVGESVRSGAAGAGVSTRLDLGGKSPNVVLADADLDRAAAGVAWSIFLHNGQVCMAGSRAVVHTDVYDGFVERIRRRAGALRLGDPLDPDTDLGPLVSRNQARTARHFTERGLGQGARLVCGGRMPEPGELPEGLDPGAYFLPTVLADVAPEDTVAQEEIFGPVLSVLRARDDADAVRVANASRYGLSAGVWSADAEHARTVAEALRAEQVWINDYRLVDLDPPPATDGPAGTAWDRVTNELDAYRSRQVVVDSTDGPPGLAPTPYHLLGSGLPPAVSRPRSTP